MDRAPFALICALLLLALAAGSLHAQVYRDLYDYDCSSGCTPSGRLTQGSDGNLYGTTMAGGSNSLGTIFMVNLAGSPYTTLWDFDATTGAPTGGLTMASDDGNFYGTTTNVLFRFNPSTNALTVLHQFTTSEGTPQGPPVEAKNRNLYGLSGIPGENGTAYRLTVPTGTFELISTTVPGFPSGPLVLASDGYFYGATLNGGTSAKRALCSG